MFSRTSYLTRFRLDRGATGFVAWRSCRGGLLAGAVVLSQLAGARAAWAAASQGAIRAAAGTVSTLPIQGRADPVAQAASVPLAGREDMDTTIAPCEDFHQYATGGFYRRQPKDGEGIEQIGSIRLRYTNGLAHPVTAVDSGVRQLVARAPALIAAGTQDSALWAVGTFYGSCLRDESGLAPGAVGDTSRSTYCFQTTRRYLERALFEVFLEHVWPPAAQAETQRYWRLLRAAGAARLEASPAFDERTKRYLRMITKGMTQLTHVPWDSLALAPITRPAGVRGPAQLLFRDPATVATWVYRDYSGLALSPTDFRQNVAQLEAAPDAVPLPVVPAALHLTFDDESAREQGRPPLTFMGKVLNDLKRLWMLSAIFPEADGPNEGEGGRGPNVPFPFFFPTLIDGQLDLPLWYGMTGWVTGHEAMHNWNGRALVSADPAALTTFAHELLQGQLYDFGHALDDAFGIVLAHDAFRAATQGRPATRIDGFTPEQRFFLGLAWGFRGEPMRLQLDGGQTRYRIAINGTLSVLPEFAQAFGCRPGTPMAGGRVWYDAPWQGLALSARDRQQLQWDYQNLLDKSIGQLVKDLPVLAAARAAALRSINLEARRALFGEPGTPGPVASPAELYQLLGQELGEVRQALPPAQQVAFDSAARHFSVDPTSDSEDNRETKGRPVLGGVYPIKIPGVPPAVPPGKPQP